MNYIVIKQAKIKSILGSVNLPYGTEVQETTGGLYFKEKPLCATTSQNAYDYFSYNDDGFGLERGKLVQSIKNTLTHNSSLWDKVWKDKICQKYKRHEYADHWLWSHEFYNAPIEDLRYIAEMIGAN